MERTDVQLRDVLGMLGGVGQGCMLVAGLAGLGDFITAQQGIY